jgi:hypothetical protein
LSCLSRLSVPCGRRLFLRCTTLLVALLGCSGLAAQARATTFTVGATQDSGAPDCIPESGTCSLRQLVDYENQLSPAPNPADTIIVPSGFYALTGGALTISQTMSITGAGARSVTIRQDSEAPDRVFDVQLAADGGVPTVSISGMTIESGVAGASNGYFGGDVLNRGNLTLRDDWITAGTASSGGGVSNQGGTVVLTHSLVSGDTASSGGADSGGIQNYGDNTVGAATLMVEESTVAYNDASLGGGIFSWCNDDPCAASGANNTVAVINSTIAYNDGGSRSSSGGGLLADQGTISVLNSIVAHNTVGSGESASDCGGTGISSLGHNLESGSDCGFSAAGDLQNTDPQFTTTFAEDNGGATDTLTIDGLSPAVDAIPAGAPGCGATDQRGVARPQGAACDIGAVEAGEPTEGHPAQIQVVADSCGLIGRATIDWGDGTSSTSDSFVATHTYAEAGTYHGTVTYADDCGTHTVAFHVKVNDAALSAVASAMSATAGRPFTGTVATFTDANPSASPRDFSATINWGDGQYSAAAIGPHAGGFIVTGSHTYSAAGSYPTTITISDVGGARSTARGAAAVHAIPTSAPFVQASNPPAPAGTRARFSGSVDPEGLSTVAHFIYGLDRRYRPADFGKSIYDQKTPARRVGSDFSSHPLAVTVAGLVPNAVYHVRLVATNSAGTTTGPDQTFATPQARAPGAPVIGKTENLRPVRGLVLIRRHGELIPLTQARQLPSGTVINALQGTLDLVSATGRKHKSYRGTFGGAVFKTTQHRFGPDRGLTTLRLIDGRFGAPAFSICKARGPRRPAGEAHVARRRQSGRRRPSSRVLQLLHASAHGHFRTRGRYAAATVRGTRWTTADRCDGTLVRVLSHRVRVVDLVRRISRLIHAGQSYLAKRPTPKRRHR